MVVFITVTKTVANVGPPVGTCNDELPEATRKGEDVTVQMPGPNGLVFYRYHAGAVVSL